MIDNVKFVVLPQTMRSSKDNDHHYINAEKLVKLYGVNRSECVVLRENDSQYDIKRVRYWHLIWLVPLYNGCYKEALEQELQRRAASDSSREEKSGGSRKVTILY